MSNARFFYFYDYTGEHRRPVVTVCRLRNDGGQYGYGWAICSDADTPCKWTGRASGLQVVDVGDGMEF